MLELYQFRPIYTFHVFLVASARVPFELIGTLFGQGLGGLWTKALGPGLDNIPLDLMSKDEVLVACGMWIVDTFICPIMVITGIPITIYLYYCIVVSSPLRMQNEPYDEILGAAQFTRFEIYLIV